MRGIIFFFGDSVGYSVIDISFGEVAADILTRVGVRRVPRHGDYTFFVVKSKGLPQLVLHLLGADFLLLNKEFGGQDAELLELDLARTCSNIRERFRITFGVSLPVETDILLRRIPRLSGIVIVRCFPKIIPKLMACLFGLFNSVLLYQMAVKFGPRNRTRDG